MLNNIKDEGFNVAFFVFAATDLRLDKGVQDALNLLNEMMSNEFMKHTYMIISHINTLEDNERDRRLE